jgi:hypothetical protein
MLNIALITLSGILFYLLYLGYPRQIFLFYILIKPVIDRFSEQGASIGGGTMRYHYIAALIIPTMSLMYSVAKRHSIFSLPLKTLVTSFIILNLFAFFIEGNYSMNNAGYYIRVIFPMFLYFSIPFFLKDKENLSRFLRYSAISGIFPCIMIFLQKLGVIVQNRVAEGLGSVVYDRATGGYADSFSVAMPIILSLFCVLFFMQYYYENKKNCLWLWSLIPIYLISLIFTFHRMAYVVVFLVITIWTMVNKRFTVMAGILLIVILSLPFLVKFVPDFYSDVLITERAANTNFSDSNQNVSNATLHGRIGVWKMLLNKFERAPILKQLFGIEMAGRAPHNDFLRVLITNGVVGLAVYIIMLVVLGIKLIISYFYFLRIDDRFMCNFALTALFIYIFYMLSSITLAISLLSTLTWFFWIFSGVTFYQMQLSKKLSYNSLKRGCVSGKPA